MNSSKALSFISNALVFILIQILINTYINALLDAPILYLSPQHGELCTFLKIERN